MEITAEQSYKENNEFLGFIKECPTSYQTVNTLKKIFDEAGFVQKEEWEYGFWNKNDLSNGYVIRNDSSIIAFRIPECNTPKGFKIVCTHTDSPMFKFKDNGEYADDTCVKLDVEKYGGMITQSWFDRPLSAAGRVVCEVDGILETILVNIDKPSFIIPSLAIHMTRGKDQGGRDISVQKEMQPVAASEGIYKLIEKQFGIKQEAVLGSDLYLYNAQEGCIMGDDRQLITAPRIDDLQCLYGALKGFVNSDDLEGDEYIRVYAAFDNEEVGSLSRQGASSDFLMVVLKELASLKNISDSGFYRMLAGSFMLSADNAHAMHPNYHEKADIIHRPHMNGGIVIKYHGAQKYTTDAFTGAFVKKMCMDSQIPYQIYYNNSDVTGGSTLGNLVMANMSVKSADIGLAQLAMHSSYETAGAYDTIYMSELIKTFFRKDTLI